MKLSIHALITLSILLTLPLSAEIRMLKQLDFADPTTAKKLELKSGTLAQEADHLHFDGRTRFTTPSGITQRDNFGFHIVLDVEPHKTFGFPCILADPDASYPPKPVPHTANSGFGLVIEKRDVEWSKTPQYTLVPIAIGIKYISAVTDHDISKAGKMHFTVIVDRGICRSFLNGKELPQHLTRHPKGSMSVINLGGHPVDALDNLGFFKGSIYQLSTFTITPGTFSPEDLGQLATTSPQQSPTAALISIGSTSLVLIEDD